MKKQLNKKETTQTVFRNLDLTIEPYCTILNSLDYGEQNAIHLNDLRIKTAQKDRELRKNIEYLRRNGCVIISNNNGYFLPSSPEEVEKYIQQEKKRAKSIFFTLKYALKYKEFLDVMKCEL